MPSPTQELALLRQHVDTCAVCAKANKRVNDFCALGRLLFGEYAKKAKPTRVEEVSLTKEQYDQLVAETKRARKSGQEN